MGTSPVDRSPVRRGSRVLWPLAVCGGALAVIALGMLARAWQLELAASVLYLFAAIAYVALRRRHRVVAALQSSLLVLLVAESVIAPAPVAAYGPILVIVVCLLAMALDRRWPQLSIPVVLLCSFALVFILSTVGAATGGERVAKAAGIALMWVVVAAAAATLRDDRPSARRLGLTVVVAAGVQVVIVALETLAGWELVRRWVAANTDGIYELRANTILGDWTIRAQGTLGYPIPLAAFLAVALVVAAVMSGLRRSVRIVLIVAFALGILLTGSRSGVVSAISGVVVYLVLEVHRRGGLRALRRRQLWVAIAATVLALLVAGYFLVRSLATADFSLFHRASVIDATGQVLFGQGPWKALFGLGYGGIERAFEDGAFGAMGASVTDNAFVSILLLTGLIGGTLFTLAIAATFWFASNRIRAILVTLVVSFFFFDAMQWHVIAFLLCVCIGITHRGAPDRVAAHRSAEAVDRNAPASLTDGHNDENA